MGASGMGLPGMDGHRHQDGAAGKRRAGAVPEVAVLAHAALAQATKHFRARASEGAGARVLRAKLSKVNGWPPMHLSFS